MHFIVPDLLLHIRDGHQWNVIFVLMLMMGIFILSTIQLTAQLFFKLIYSFINVLDKNCVFD